MPPPPAATALLTALIVGTSQSLLLYTARGAGLETGLFTLLLLVAVWLYLVSTQNAECRMQHAGRLALLPADQRPRTAHTIALIACGATLALLSMTRPEGVLIAGLTGLHLLISEVGSQKSAGGAPGAAQGPSSGAAPHAARRAAIRRITSRLGLLTAAFMAVFLPYFLWRLSYYGDLLPNTFYAKTGGGLQQALRGLGYAGGFALTLGGPLLLVILLPWLRGWRAALGSWRGYLLPVALIYSAYVVAVGGDHFRGERFFVPILPLIAILLADGLAQAWWVALAQGPMAVGREPRALGRGPWADGREPGAESQGPRAATRAPWAGRAGAYAIRPYGIWHVALALLFLTGGLAALARTAPIDATMRGLDESVWIWREIGWWVADHGPPEASVAAQGAGAIAFYSQRTTIDLLGLTDKHIGRLEVSDMGAGVAGHEKRDPAYVLNVRRPTYIPQIWEGYFGGAPGLRAQYDLVPIVTRSGRELGMWVRR